MAVVSSSEDKTETSPVIGAGESPSENFSGDQSSTPKGPELQRQTSQRSEEYRQLFRLPGEEVLIRDYNCAVQENFLLQGHMYVFDHFICFYSNLFGFETKKVIPFNEVTAVRRAKAAGIFPTAIEIEAGEKKHFFTSFLSRDDAYKLLKDGWSQYDMEVKDTDPQSTKSELSIQENGDIVTENASNSKPAVDDADLSERQDIPINEDSNLRVEVEVGSVSTSSAQQIVKDIVDSVVKNSDPCSRSNPGWVEENYDAPKVSDSYTKVAESKFPIRVEEFFSFFCSDDAVGFLESYHQSCGDIDFKCSSWHPDEKFGYSRDVSFKHPIKVYLAAKCGTCQEIQKYRVYKNSHLVIETSQNVKDVPYGDYFLVEGIWDVERDGDDLRRSCIARVYVNVAFSKYTIFKGKIVQTTIDEARDAYDIWIKKAHELLQRKKLEEEKAEDCATNSNTGQVGEDTEVRSVETLERPELADDTRTSLLLVGQEDDNKQTRVSSPGINSATLLGLLRESMSTFYVFIRSRSQVPLLIVIAFALILLLMQISIVVLLSRPQKIQLVPQLDPQLDYRSSSIERKHEMMSWMAKRIEHFKEEMSIIESMIEKMRHDHKLLKAQLEELELFRRLQMD